MRDKCECDYEENIVGGVEKSYVDDKWGRWDNVYKVELWGVSDMWERIEVYLVSLRIK